MRTQRRPPVAVLERALVEQLARQNLRWDTSASRANWSAWVPGGGGDDPLDPVHRRPRPRAAAGVGNLAAVPGLGEQHLRNVLAEYAQHFNGHRPHQTCSEPPQREPSNAIDMSARIERREVLSGLISGELN
jgi:hypothetical protein